MSLDNYDYDLVVVGAGPGGIQAVKKAVSKGLKVALVEKNEIGGTCLNVGCIPTKTLIVETRNYDKLKNLSKLKGIGLDPINWKEFIDRKEKVVSLQRKSVISFLQKAGVNIYQKTKAVLKDSHTLELSNLENNEVSCISGKYIILATGSINKDILGVDGKSILNSDQILSLDKLPTSLAVIGGGVIGMEFSSIFSKLGVKVTVFEYASRILPLEDSDVSAEITKILSRRKIKFETSVGVEKIEYIDDDKVKVVVKGSNKEFVFDKVLVCVGRAPNTKEMNLESIGIELDQKGFIKVDSLYRTKISNIYAIGDIINTISLAHVASMEATVAVEDILGNNPSLIDYSLVPSAIYTIPEVASVGVSEDKLEEGTYKVAKYMMSNSVKSFIEGERDGFVKIIFSTKDKKILGASIVADKATEMISDLVVCKQSGMNIKELARCIRPHPSISEAISECVAMVEE